MFADRYLTKDELFAAGAVFTLIAWGFAFLYNICQLLVPMSFSKPDHQGLQSWLDLLFLSFSLQSATGLSDIFPISPAARVISILQMFMGVMFLAVVVSRLVALQYISHLPEKIITTIHSLLQLCNFFIFSAGYTIITRFMRFLAFHDSEFF